ncbi:MAG: hypothetical protein ACI8QF_004559 [Limisphaerales bacterium]|jgi:hypothetical protein
MPVALTFTYAFVQKYYGQEDFLICLLLLKAGWQTIHCD